MSSCIVSRANSLSSEAGPNHVGTQDADHRSFPSVGFDGSALENSICLYIMCDPKHTGLM